MPTCCVGLLFFGSDTTLNSQRNSDGDKMTVAGEDNRPVFFAYQCNGHQRQETCSRRALKPHLSQPRAAARLMELRAQAVSSPFCSHRALTIPGDSTGNTNKVVRGHQTARVNCSIHARCCHQCYSVRCACTPRSSRERCT